MSTKHSKARIEFADRVRKLRLQHGFEHARDFAQALGMDAVRYARIERGEVEPAIGAIMDMCAALKTDPNTLLGYEA